MSLNLNIGNVSISGLETASTEQIDLIISYLNNVKQNGLSLSEEKEKKYIFRATFIRMLADFLLENKVRLRDNFYSGVRAEWVSFKTFVYEIPDDHKRYSYLLNDTNFWWLCTRLIDEVKHYTPTDKCTQEQYEKSRNILLELKRKL